MRPLARLGFVLSALALPGACTAPASPQHVFHGTAMGTTYAVTVVGEAAEGAGRAAIGARIERTLDAVDAAMSTYLAGSELSRFNRSSSRDPFPVSRGTLVVLEQARAVSELTGGAFDVTVAPLVDAWGFGPDPARDSEPADALLERIRAAVGYELLHVDAVRSTISKAHPDLEVDVSASAKGYGVDRVAAVLDAAGIEAYLIEVGGEVRARGRRPDGRRWQVGIERPSLLTPGLQRVVELEDAALATSGDYRNFIEEDGRRRSHLIDPRSGRPVRHNLAAVSVIDRECMRADSLATALAVLGLDAGYELAVAHGWAVLLVERLGGDTYRERATPAFEDRVDAPVR